MCPADIRNVFHCYMLQVSGVGFTWCKTVVEFPSCGETVAITVSMELTSGAFRSAQATAGCKLELLKIKVSKLDASLNQNEQRSVE